MKARSKYEWRNQEPVDLAVLIERELDGRDYDGGSLEHVVATADNCVRVLARVSAALVERKLLTLDDLGIVGIELVDDNA